MIKNARTVVIGIGEVGGPLANILARAYNVVRVDLAPVDLAEPVQAVHICYPQSGNDFVAETLRYLEIYRPLLAVIHSTVIPGTTLEVEKHWGKPVVFSPVRGKHWRMESDMLRYRKFVAGTDSSAIANAVEHLSGAGFQTETVSSSEALELMKLLETTYFGLLIAWAQEVNRFAKKAGTTYDEVIRFWKEISDDLPIGYTPGFIGGHCVIPNIDLLRRWTGSEFFEVIVRSNEKKAQELSLTAKLAPSRAGKG